jgi:surfactin synthase thioesterase subunit
MSADRWFGVRRPVANPVVRLYCFPHSGGSPGEYLRWADQLPGVEVVGVKLPGRGGRMDEPSCADVRGLAAALLDDAVFTLPFALFGHSFGALLAYEVTQELRARGREQPGRLVVSGYGPPHLSRAAPPMSHLPDRELLEKLGGFYGGVPAELLADPDLAALVLPAYRADLAALEHYLHRERPPLQVPLAVLGGDRDVFTPEQLAGWQRYAAAEYRLTLLPGGHFYFREQPEALLRELRGLFDVAAAHDA